jgi:hypothetical protein
MIWFSRSGWRTGLPLALLPAAVMVQGPLVARGTEPVLRVLLEQAGSLRWVLFPHPCGWKMGGASSWFSFLRVQPFGSARGPAVFRPGWLAVGAPGGG